MEKVLEAVERAKRLLDEAESQFREIEGAEEQFKKNAEQLLAPLLKRHEELQSKTTRWQAAMLQVLAQLISKVQLSNTPIGTCIKYFVKNDGLIFWGVEVQEPQAIVKERPFDETQEILRLAFDAFVKALPEKAGQLNERIGQLSALADEIRTFTKKRKK